MVFRFVLTRRYVLPNHQLFVLAEQPPVDITGLLSMFQHVPAVIRRRAKELLDTIRDAAKERDVVPEVVRKVTPLESEEVVKSVL